jgi:hypothetical protein
VNKQNVIGPPQAKANAADDAAFPGRPLRRAVVLAHFDRDGLIDPHLRASIASLVSAGADVLVVSANLSPNEPAPDGVRVLRRENAGYDFGSWQAGLRALGPLGSFDEIVLMNDSFYIARDAALPRALDALRRLPYDICSLTASREIQFHLQSYFLVFRPAALRSAWFSRFWSAVSPADDRAAAILLRELPLAAQARAVGLRVGALLHPPHLPPFELLTARWAAGVRAGGRRGGVRAMLDALRGVPPQNPTLHRWAETARRCGVVKVELLRDNPRGADLSGLADVMEPTCFDRAQRHLARLRASEAPSPG